MSASSIGEPVSRHCYTIVVSGRLGDISREAFAEFTIESSGANTALTGEFNQTGLYDTLKRIQSLGLELAALTRVPSHPDEVSG